MSRVPVFDLSSAITEIEDELHSRWDRLLRSKQFVGGEEVRAFESSFAEFLGAEECVGVGNGTDALVLALKTLGVTRGDEVLVPAFTFAATGSSVVWSGARPVFVDVQSDSLNINPNQLEGARTAATVGVIGVHLYGRPFDTERVSQWCRTHGLWLIEDAAQAHGANVNGRRVGTLGDLATWSFYPSKNLGCFGDGGAVTGMSRDLVAKARLLANHGAPSRYDHHEVGTNSRLDAFQAAVLNCRLPLLDAKNSRRSAVAHRYLTGLSGIPGLSCVDGTEEGVYHQFGVLTERRDELQSFLSERGIGTAVHYPAALPDQPCFAAALADAADSTSVPVSRRAAREVLCLPMFPEIEDEAVAAVIAEIRAFFGSQRT